MFNIVLTSVILTTVALGFAVYTYVTDVKPPQENH